MPELIEELTYHADLAMDQQSFLVGQGRVLPGPRVEYRVFRLAN